MGLSDVIEELRLLDHHVHTVRPGPVPRTEFETYLTESDQPAPAGTTHFDSQLGFAVRRWCAPLLDFDPAAAPDDYLAHRNALPAAQVTGRLLTAAGCGALLIDTGYIAPGSLTLPELAAQSGAAVHEIVRLETVAADLALAGCSAADFGPRYGALLAERTTAAVGLKSIMAYRYGLDFDPARPSRYEVTAAAGAWLRTVEKSGQARLADPVLLRAVLWAGVERGLPIQFHTGFGDPDLDLRRANPAAARDFLAAVSGTGVPVILLHCYPFHREAAFLAQAYPHVYFDLGMTMHYVGARAATVLAEALELAPFGKVLYSSDAFGLPELVYLGARIWRNSMSEVLGGWVAGGHWTESDAVRIANLIASDNAARIYRLPATRH
jgi:uncharacterized protein